MPLNLFNRSEIALQISRHLIPIAVVAAVSCTVAIALYALVFFPAQKQLANATAAYNAERENQRQKQAAMATQEQLDKIWKGLPARKDFNGLSVDIAALAKSHKVHIPGMGYDFRDFRHKLASKGTVSFEAAGQYEAIRQFIYELESSWSHLFIEKLSVERTKRHNEVTFTIKVATFLIDEKKSATTSSKQL